MPYKNIVFVKLEKRLLNDHRWFSMSDKAQLLYVKLMLGCAETYNKLPTNSLTLRKQLRIEWRKDVFDSAIKEIQDNFPRFKKDGDFYYFEEFETKTNYIRDCPSNAQELPKEVTDIDKEKEKDIEKEDGQAEVEKLFIRKWSRNFKNLPELMEACNLVKEYGFKKVEEAFHKAAIQDVFKVNYVKGILLDKPKGSYGTNKGQYRKGDIDFDKYQRELATESPAKK